MPECFWQVAVEAPLPSLLTYKFEQELTRGQAVVVPLGNGNRLVNGVICSLAEAPSDTSKIKSIASISSELPVLSESFMRWLEWLSQYYMHPPGMVMQSVFPPLGKASKVRKSKRPPVIPNLELETKPELTLEQKNAIESIQSHKGFSAHLLFGVTGSGKTEVYLRLLESVLESGKSGLVLVPEISLTPQLIQRFARRFGDKIAALHSQLTDRERTNQWWDVVSGQKQILIGARSALFCPIPNLDIIIVDEEHEPSFKQEEKLKYHGRDAAVMMGKLFNVPVILGSATPSLETWNNTLEKRYKLHQLKSRVGERALPDIKVIDLRKSDDDELEKDKKANYSHIPFWMSPELYEEINYSLANKEQVALFLNRRGLAQMVLCPACGHTVQCPNCDINLTLHAGSHLVCHYCDYHENFKSKCSDCNEGELEAVGLGTELIEKDLSHLYPEAKIARADRDEISTRSELEELISQMENGEIDILVGTQMIAKGLDFPNLKLVGLILADVGFNLPDFRATERSFQLITQMSGRAGRHVKPGQRPGLVFIQTYNTEHESVTFALQHDFVGFAENELQVRQALNYPPYGKLAGVRIQGTKLQVAERMAHLFAHRCRQLKEQFPAYKDVEVLGPAEAPLAKLRNNFRFHVLLKAPQAQILNSFCRQALGTEDWIASGVKISIDVDPMNLL